MPDPQKQALIFVSEVGGIDNRTLYRVSLSETGTCVENRKSLIAFTKTEFGWSACSVLSSNHNIYVLEVDNKPTNPLIITRYYVILKTK
jgi:hypothetical protein